MGDSCEQSIQRQKQRLRETMRQLRSCLSDQQVQAAAKKLIKPLGDLLDQVRGETGFGPGAARIGCYSAIRNEADLSEAIGALSPEIYEIYYPVTDRADDIDCLRFARLPEQVAAERFLQPGRFGILEPPHDACLADLPRLDMILLPGLAFDLNGNRLGWGKAYYDRLIAGLDPKPILVGVCYDFQITEDDLPSEASDQAVDWLLTPEGFIACKS